MHGQKQTPAPDGLISWLADRQHGVVARSQLLSRGVSAEAIDVRVEGRRLHLLHRGVYAVGHRVLSQPGRWMAAVLACGEGAVLSHRTAAALWGIRGAGGPIHVTSPRKCRARKPIRRHYSVLPTDETTKRGGIPVTTVPRTILDLAARAEPEVVESALREAEHRQLTDSLSLPHLLERYPRRRGTPIVRAALERLAESPGRVESRLEERFLPFLDRYDLPRPQFNAWLEVAGHRYRVDCLWSATRQIVELDSWESHGTRPAFHSDRTRDRRLHAAGYAVTRLTWAQLDAEPELIAADLRAVLYKRM